ncbi:site-specific DNA-methyltransferase [Gardnerella vaginalis]|nr:site-specific DNA-methyltransferase [Gardnerella vaginalis]
MAKRKKVYDLKGQEIEGFFFKENGRLYSKKIMSTASIKSILKDIPDTQAARKELEALFGSQDVFSYPKPYELVKLFAKLATDPGDIVMDFFSGSATTAQAVMQLNAEDDTDRKYILAQILSGLVKILKRIGVGLRRFAKLGKSVYDALQRRCMKIIRQQSLMTVSES